MMNQPEPTDEEIQKQCTESILPKTLHATQLCGRSGVLIMEQPITPLYILPLPAITPPQLQYWLRDLFLRLKGIWNRVSPQTLHHLCSRIHIFMHQNGQPSLDIYKDHLFAEFHSTLKAEMKQFQQLCIGSKKRQAEPLTEEEEVLWL